MINKKVIAKQVGLILLIMVIGTIIDYLVHSSRAEFYVPPYYYRNKIIFATLWGLGALWIFQWKIHNPTKLAVAVSALVAVVLQTKYFLEGYTLSFVFLFMFLHFLMFAAPALIIFRKFPRIFIRE